MKKRIKNRLLLIVLAGIFFINYPQELFAKELIIFLLDTSGSMSSVLELCKNEILKVMKSENPDTETRKVYFIQFSSSSNYTEFFNIEYASEILNKIQINGGTNLEPAINNVFYLIDNVNFSGINSIDIHIFSDLWVSGKGITSLTELEKKVSNKFLEAKINIVIFCYYWDDSSFDRIKETIFGKKNFMPRLISHNFSNTFDQSNINSSNQSTDYPTYLILFVSLLIFLFFILYFIKYRQNKLQKMNEHKISELDNCETVKVFISYAKEDSTIACKVYNDLKNKNTNILPWIDSENIFPGENWKTVIHNAIKNTDFFLALISSNSITKRGFVQNELKLAMEVLDDLPSNHIFIIPVRVEDIVINDEKLYYLQWVDIFSSYDEGLNKIISVLNKK